MNAPDTAQRPLAGRLIPLLLCLVALAALSLALAPPVDAQAAGGDDLIVTPDPAPPPLPPLWTWDPNDPRIGLGADEEAMRGLEHIANAPRPENFGTNSDIAFGGDLVFLGNYNGFNVYDVRDPRTPRLRVSVLCPGNQGDLSVYRNLLFKSVQAASSRLDCGTDPAQGDVNRERFRGVRIFDITDVDNPRQVAAVQTCRGSHTHSLVTHPGDTENVYIYVSGTSGVRPGEELPGCVADREDPNTSYFQVEVIRVPLAAPERAAIVNEPRVFAAEQGDPAGLRGLERDGTPGSAVNACHDITAYAAIGLAGGACSGNGLLLDISDPANPMRITEVADANFAYWHSATFNNDGTRVVFTDEWGGGGAPRCRAEDPPNWGGNAIFDITPDKGLVHRSYYKLPVPQTEDDGSCVAHNGSLIPVPGRDIMVQAWYGGGMSIYDFTDPGNPYEIAFFDRGPGGGFWSTYWHNGYIYGSEMRRGLDVFRLTPTEHLSQNEIDAAMSVRFEDFNPQNQPKIEWPVSFPVTRSYVDQLERARVLGDAMLTRLRTELTTAERASGGQRRGAADRLVATAAELDTLAVQRLTAGRTDNATRLHALLASSLRDLAATLR